MQRRPTALIAFWLALAGSGAFAEPRWMVLAPGPVQADDLGDYRASGQWFALHQKGPMWHLSSAHVTVVKTEAGDFEIRSSQLDSLVLLQGNLLKNRPVEAASLIASESGGAATAFEFKGIRYSLVVQPVQVKYRSPKTGQTYDNVRNDVYLTDGKRRTLVYGGSDSRQSCDHPVIRWAGDIDGDGKSDVIVDFDDDSQKNGSLCVFLSSHARGSALLRKGACQFFSG